MSEPEPGGGAASPSSASSPEGAGGGAAQPAAASTTPGPESAAQRQPDAGAGTGTGTGGAAQSGGAQQTPTLVKKGGSVEAGEGGVSKEVQDAVASGVDTAAASALEYANYLDHQRDEGWKD